MGTPSTAFVKQYSDTITMLAQQFDSKLSACVMVDNSFKGEKKFYDQYSSDSFTEIISAYADTPTDIPNHQRRAIVPRYFVSNTLEDPKDALQMLIDPKSAYMQAKQAAANRKKDDLIISALGGTALTGQEGTTSTAFDSNNQIAVTYGSGTSNSGMTKAKVLRARKILADGDVEAEDRYAVASPAQFEDLLNLTEVESSDYNVVKALVQGEINTWVGFRWIESTRLTTDGSSHRLCYFWQKKGMQMAIQKDVEGRIDPRPDKNYAMQVYMRLCFNATRLEEARVVEVACAES